MKRFLSLFLVLILALSALASCADSTTSEETESATQTETDAFTFTPVGTETETETEIETETETEPETTAEDVVVVNPTDNTTPVTPNNDPVPVFTPGSYSSDPLISRMTFLGDSTTYGLKYYGVVADDKVWTPSNGTLAIFRATTDYIHDPVTGGEYTVADMCAKYTPDILVITLGINGISFMDETSFKSYYQMLIDAVKQASPSTHIALQTMYPLCASYDTSSGITQDKVNAGNKWINDLAATNGIACINSAPSLVTSSGYRPEEWQNGDGLHMSEQGFAAVMNYMVNNPCY